MKIRHITESDYQEMVATIEEQKKLINELQCNRITADKIIDEKGVIKSLSNVQAKIESCLSAFNKINEAQKSFIGNKDAVYEKTNWGYYKVRDVEPKCKVDEPIAMVKLFPITGKIEYIDDIGTIVSTRKKFDDFLRHKCFFKTFRDYIHYQNRLTGIYFRAH